MSILLSAIFVKKVKSVNKQEMYSDGRDGYGLFLRVRARAGGGENKAWVQRISFKKERLGLGLGSYPAVSLKRAREKAWANAILVDKGVDPRKSSDGCPTFREAAAEAILLFSEGMESPTYADYKWHNPLERYVMPFLGDKRVDEIETADIMDFVTPIWSAKPAAAREVLGRVRRIMVWCMSKGLIEHNPVNEIVKEALPKKPWVHKHFDAVPYRDVADAVKKIRTCSWSSRHALEFAIFTACRGVEVRRAQWSEVDWDSRIWTIPAGNIKSRREHRVPLSTGAMRLLEAAFERREEGCDRVFSAMRGCNLMPQSLFGIVCRVSGVDGMPHGFRSTFRDWCGESGVPRDVAEAALAHVVGGAEGAYARSDLFNRRLKLMQDWSDYIDGKLPDDWYWTER